MPNNSQTLANNAITTLSSTANAGDATINVVAASGFPATGPFTIQIDNELLLVTAGFNTQIWTVTRAQEGTSAAQHIAGAQVSQELTLAAVNALGTGYWTRLYPGGIGNATAALGFVGATTTGAPTSGNFFVGDVSVDQIGRVWICTVAGNPGTWTVLGVGNVYANIHMASNQNSVPNNTLTTVAYDTKDNDPSNSFNTTTHAFTAPLPGLYDISAAVQWVTTTNPYNPVLLSIVKNGTEARRGTDFWVTGNAFTPSSHVSAKMRLTLNDVITIGALQNSGGASAINAGAALTWLDIVFLGGN